MTEPAMDQDPAGAVTRRAATDGCVPLHDTSAYTALLGAERAWWKRLLNTQAPYRRNIRRVVEGRLLDVGCGIGRNLAHLDGNGVGVDTNVHSIEVAKERGFSAFTDEEFTNSDLSAPGAYDTVLFAHVLEHMPTESARTLVTHYLAYLRPGGRLAIIVPQEAGFKSDETHVAPVDVVELHQIAADNRLTVERITSFPLPRFAGRFFAHNETVALLRKPE